MERLRQIVLEAEDRIVRSVMSDARTHGYGHYMPALEDAYRMGVATVSANLVQVLSVSGDVPDIRAGASPDEDAIASLGERFARMRKGDGVDLSVFLGLLKYYRRAYVAAVRDAGADPEEERLYLATIDRYFDHLEMGYVSTWSSYTLADISGSVAERNLSLTAEKNRYLSTFGELPLPVFLLDARGRVENLNAAAADLFSPVHAGRGAYFSDPSRREAPPVLREEIRSFSASEAHETSMDREIRTGKGTRYFEARLTKLIGFEGENSGMLVVLTDLTYRRTAEDALRRSQSKYASLFENMLTAFAYMKVVLDKRNRPVDYEFVEVNGAFERIAGKSSSFLTGRRFTDIPLGIDDSRHDWMGTLGTVAVTGETASFDALVEPLDRWYSVSAYSPSPGYVTMMLSDISELKRQERQLEHLATHDVLTDLPNRRVFEEALRRAVAHARRGHPSSLLFIDVDGFKAVNDSLGHAEGDLALVDVTSRIHEVIRAEDMLARIGGDEFAALLTDSVLAEARGIAERIRTTLRDVEASRPDHSLDLTLSIGLVEIDGLVAADTVLSQADGAMYRAKDSGGDRVVVFQPGFEPDSGDRETAAMLAKLKDALSRDGAFLFHYQPVFRVADGTIEYFEALTRLVDREQRVIPPGQFIGVAERFGLMPQLTRWVVRQAAAVLAANPELRLSVNLSGLDVEDAVLLDDVLHTLKSRSVEPLRLSFEMSETSVLRDVGAAHEWISRARDAGFGFALDDFGAGTNSFAYLRSLPVDRVKIDGRVTRSLVADPRQLTLLEAVRAVTSMRGVRTVAECVENEYVLEIVRNVGVDLAQGYHLGRPSSDLGGAPVDWSSRFPAAREG